LYNKCGMPLLHEPKQSVPLTAFPLFRIPTTGFVSGQQALRTEYTA
jgi:hypothetical protein